MSPTQPSNTPTGSAAVDAPVRGGTLRAGRWHAGSGPVVLAVHGITASHLAWGPLARSMTDVDLVAPDLRGRGLSATLPGPTGFEQHVADLLALLDHLGVSRVVVAGHSMGGFVAARFAVSHPERVRGLVLVDGGLPLLLPASVSVQQAIGATLGPAAGRIGVDFASLEAYRDLWRAHPALGPWWGPHVQAYVDYDLVEVEPGVFRSRVVMAALEPDAADLFDQSWATSVLQPLLASGLPMSFLRAPRGLLDQPDALYREPEYATILAALPGLRQRTVPDVNHYTILFEPPGVAAVAADLRRVLAEASERDPAGG